MAAYRRFVAYVYEYQGEQKKENRGFVRVEARNGNCVMEIHMQCPNLAPDQECRIYGFLRKNQDLMGVELGTCETSAGKIDCRLVNQADNLQGQSVGLDDLGGMILRIGDSGFYGTQWDDRPISPMAFVMPKQEIEQEQPDEQQVLASNVALQENMGQEIQESQESPEEDTAEDPSVMQVSETEKEEVEEKKENSEPEKEVVMETENCRQQSEEDAAPEQSLNLEREAASQLRAAEELVSEPETEPESEVPLQSEEVPLTEEPSPTEEPLNQSEPSANQPSLDAQGCADAFWPFEDGEIIDSIKIHPGDIRYFHRRDWGLRNNRFLLHGYQQFGHLLLGKIRSTGQYVMGVPGIYNKEEQMMANMFGFPHFKASRRSEMTEEEGQFGYWYRLVNPPNLNMFDGLC